MSGRRVWAMMLLTAVFSLHGLQCAAADAGSPHIPAGVHAPTGDHTPSGDHASTEAHATTGDRAPVGAAQAGTPGHEHGVWVVCLVALLAGVALVGAAVRTRGRLQPLIRARAAGSLPPNWWPTPLRPPDLAALCLLRI